MAAQVHVISGVNPEPWAVGTAHAGRRDGQLRAGISPNHKLQSYQNAFRDALKDLAENTAIALLKGDIRIRFWFWRQVEVGHQGEGRRALTGNYADATNLQKATEDAMQGTFFTNDRMVRDIQSTIVEQGPDVTPSIAFLVELYRPTEDKVMEQALRLREFSIAPRRAAFEPDSDSPWGAL